MPPKEEKLELGKLELALTYEELAFHEIVSDEIFFQEFLLPSPGSQTLLSEYLWTEDEERVVWYLQYPFVLWPIVVGECGRAVGKTTVGMQGGTLYDMVNFNNTQSAVVGPSEQHARRVFDEVINVLYDHRILRDWIPLTDARRSGVIERSQRKIRTKNGWELHGLIPGIQGIGIKGEHPNRLRCDEVQNMSIPGMANLDDAIRPFDPIKYGSREQFFGVPDGNRTSRYYEMCHDVTGKWSSWIIRIPSYLSPTYSRENFLDMLKRTNCQFQEVLDDSIQSVRIVVTAWSNTAKQNTLGQWGDPAFPCFPTHVYDACTISEGTPNYFIISITPQSLQLSGLEPEILVRQALMQGPTRDTFNASKIFITLDPGRELCPVLVWAKVSRSNIHHPALWWLVERIDCSRIMDTTTLAKIVDTIADFWQADWVAADATSQSVYVTDYLCDDALYGFKGRLKLWDTTKGKATNEKDGLLIGVARGWRGQVILPVDFSGVLPIRYDPPGPVLATTDIYTVRLLQDLMQATDPKILLPRDHQDQSFFGQMTSYREVIGAGGGRFQPAHPHWVSAAKVFAACILYAELLNIDAIETEIEDSSGDFLSSNIRF